jgi:succinyl-diaminopimelate desuccinylase
MTSMAKPEELWRLVRAHEDDIFAFAQRLVQTPSLSGQEGQVAALVQAEMERLGYDAAWLDGAGNVTGRIDGGDGAPVMFNGHLDHVDAGDPAQWTHPPFAGEIHGGDLWGRASVDMKGAIAAMVYAGALAKKWDAPLPCDLYVSGTVQEETGGLGARHLARSLPALRVVVGEASGNQLRRGHRGRLELVVHFEGRSVHAAMPHLGVNPHFSLARFLDGLKTLPMAADPDFGASTVAPTRVQSEPQSTNVTPSALHLVLDWRNVPGEGPEEMLAKVGDLQAGSKDPGCRCSVQVAVKELVSYTGIAMEYEDAFPSFATAADDPYLLQAQAVLSDVLARDVEIGSWRFATDGGHFAEAGATVIGFGPGDDRVAHTVEERLSLDQLVESVVGYLAILMM